MSQTRNCMVRIPGRPTGAASEGKPRTYRAEPMRIAVLVAWLLNER
ncbi:hypothetical protein [Dictyobacter kobayashii]|nr:hypothetical protein [Dictyobacter kobayashii]